MAISKALSMLLRHRPHDFGLALEPQGWGEVSDVIAALERMGHHIDACRMIHDGLAFWRADNGVCLTERVAPIYLSVEERTKRRLRLQPVLQPQERPLHHRI